MRCQLSIIQHNSLDGVVTGARSASINGQRQVTRDFNKLKWAV